MSKKRSLAVLIFITVIAAFFVYDRREKNIYGYVLDCNTNEPVKGVEISANQRGWGISNGGVVWDKDYISLTKTDGRGYFKLFYKVGSSADLIAKKQGYLNAVQYEYPNKEITIKMLPEDKSGEVTYNCTPSSQCLSCSTENGVEVCKNICLQSE